MKTTQRNTEAEQFQFVVIPKDTILPCGITEVEVHENILGRGPNKGRSYDKYKLRVQPLAGQFKGNNIGLSVSCNVERRYGVDGVEIDPWGNSRRYVELLRGVGMQFADEAMPIPESEEEAKEFGNSLVGKSLVITFGTYTFKDDEGKDVTINTMKSAMAVTPEMRAELEASFAEWEAEAAAMRGGGALGSSEDDDDIPFGRDLG